MASRMFKVEPTTLQTSIPAFLLKLRGLLDDEDTDEWIFWDQSGLSFHLHNQAEFAKEILPKYFKHSNLASFVRQLNMYGFKKVSTIDSGSLHSTDNMEFQNPHFVRDRLDLMGNIRRKNPKTDNKLIDVGTVVRDRLTDYIGSPVIIPDQLGDVISDVSELKSSQKGLDNQLEIIKKENSVLWREIASLRQKHVQQQHIINKLIQFLMTMARTKRSTNLKRPYQLMIEPGPSAGASNLKRAREADIDTAFENSSFGSSSSLSNSEQAPGHSTIQHVSEPDDFYPTTLDNADSNDGTDERPSGAVLLRYNTRPPMYNEVMSQPNHTAPPNQINISLPTQRPGDSLSLGDSLLGPLSPSIDPDLFKSQFSENIDDVQSDIDLFKDLFTNDSLHIPQETYNVVFDGSSDKLPSNMDDFNEVMENSNSRNNLLQIACENLPEGLPDAYTEGDLEELIQTQAKEDKQANKRTISSRDLD